MFHVNHVEIYIKSVEVFILSAVKFIFAAPLSFLNGFNYVQTVLITAIGGIAGVLFFYYLSGWFFKKTSGFKMNFYKNNAAFKRISKWEKFLIEKIRIKYGLFGIIVLTPVLFSIPIGAIIANKYYSGKKRIPFYLTLSVIGWSFIIATIFKFLL